MDSRILIAVIVSLIVGIAVGVPLGGTFLAPAPTTVTTTITASPTAPAPSGATTVTTTVTSTITKTEAAGGELPKTILIGHLISYTVRDYKAAADIAIEEVNEYVEKLGLPVRFKIIHEYTEFSPVKALEKLQSLAMQGVKVVIGPDSSSETAAIMEFANKHHILIVSPLSTSPKLAIPDDFIFRVITNDTVQAPILARVIKQYGVDAAAVIQRGDAYGDGLTEAFIPEFEKIGGKIVVRIRFDPEKPELSSETALLADKVSEAINKYGADKVAVVVIAMGDDAVKILSVAQKYPDLLKVTWFGPDGVAYAERITKECGSLAAKVKLICTVQGAAITSKYREFSKKFEERTGVRAYTAPMYIYDAVWIVAKAILEAGRYDADAIKTALPYVANQYFGVGGWYKLNKAGDRDAMNYFIIAVVSEEGKYVWKEIGVYSWITGEVTWFGAYGSK